MTEKMHLDELGRCCENTTLSNWWFTCNLLAYLRATKDQNTIIDTNVLIEEMRKNARYTNHFSQYGNGSLAGAAGVSIKNIEDWLKRLANGDLQTWARYYKAILPSGIDDPHYLGIKDLSPYANGVIVFFAQFAAGGQVAIYSDFELLFNNTMGKKLNTASGIVCSVNMEIIPETACVTHGELIDLKQSPLFIDIYRDDV